MENIDLIHKQLLDMDIERIINISLFFFVLWFGMRILLSIRRKTQNNFLKSACMTVTLLVAFLLFLEIFTRITYSVRHGEINFLIYPLRTFTRDYINLEWTPLHFFNGKSGLLIETIPTVTRSFSGLSYYRATQNEMGFRFDSSQYPKDTFNIVCVGGSSTWGMNSDGQTYPDHLQTFLKKDKVQVYNLGKRSHQSHQFQEDLIKSNLLKNIRVDLLILYVGHNDSHTHYQSFKGFEKIRNSFKEFANTTIFPKYSLLARTIALLSFSNKYRHLFEDEIMKKAPVPQEAITHREQQFRKNIMDLIHYIQDNNNKNLQAIVGIEFTNFVVPFTEFRNLYKLDNFQDSSSMEIYKMINYEILTKDHALQELSRVVPQVHYLNIDFFSKFNPSRLLSDHVHLRSYGNKILGQELAGFIRQNILSAKYMAESN